jgi:hypothetical protein
MQNRCNVLTDGRVANESLRQQQVRCIRPDRLLGRDPLPFVQVGPQVHRSGQ